MRETLLSFLDDCVARGEQSAVVHWRGLRISRWSYAQLARSAFQFARGLEARGIGTGDRVLFWSENSPEWIVAFYGCLLRGAVVVPLDLKSAPDFAARVQQQVSAKLLLADHAQLDLPSLSLANLTDVIAQYSDEPYSRVAVNPDDLIEIVFTSGTTAEPKGVCLTHRNLLANIGPIEKEFERYKRWERLVHPLRFLCLLPLSHVFGQLMGIFIPEFMGAEVCFRESYKPSEIINVVKKQRVNVVVTVPRVLETLRDKLKRDANLSDEQLAAAEGRHFLRNWWTFRNIHRQFGWRFWAFISGGATLESDTETFWRRVGYAVIQGYGMTETASLTSLSHPFRTQRGSIGKPVRGQEVKLSDDGEILVRGENVSPGYWNGANQPLTDAQGWIHTGDIGEVGPNGSIYFRGRRKDTIVTAAGLKIFPADLEAALDHQAEIKESAVVPLPESKGTEPLAVLIPRDDRADLNAAVQRANDSLAEFQRIRHWVVWPASDFPRTGGTRKVIKGKIVDAIRPILNRNQTPAVAQSSLAPLSLPVISRITGADAMANMKPSANLADDLKLDSLGRVELLSALEDQYQIELDEAAITKATTVADIEKIVSRGKSEATAYPYPRWAMRFPTTWLRPVVYQLFLFPLTLIMCRVRVVGAERLANISGPALLISNHVTDADAGLILSALPRRLRSRLAIAMQGEMLRDWRYPPATVGWFQRVQGKVMYALGASLFNVFPIPRQSGFRQSFAYAGEAVDHCWSILIFPEGEETKDGQIQPFKAGIGLLASELNVPVIAINLRGLFELKQRRQFFVRPGTVTVTFGDPITFPPNTPPAEITETLELTLKSV